MTWKIFHHAPPHHKFDWVEISVHLRRVSDGLERVYKTDGVLMDDKTNLSTWIWEEGNYSCDCNRYLFFQRAGKEGEEEEVECTDGKYIVWIVNPLDGNVVYDERDDLAMAEVGQ